MTDQLKPCPCCGGKAKLNSDIFVPFQVICKNPNCDLAGRISGDKQKVINAWNRRRIPEGYILIRKPSLVTKGEPMPQTIEHWQELAGGYEEVMLKDKEEISRLKQQVNNLQQKLQGGSNV